jgi:uncharacterized protein
MSSSAAVPPVVPDSLLVKLAMRCNIACTYCYWFRDETVYDAPALLDAGIENALVEKLDIHLERHRLRTFRVMFHGGEPLLFGKQRFGDLCRRLLSVAARRACKLRLSLQTNGMLVDEEWAELLRDFDVDVGVSLDGPSEINDRRRVDFEGSGTHARTLRGIALLQQAEVRLGVLAVCDPSTNARLILRHLVDELGVDGLDILVPDATHEDRPASIAPFYRGLFDLWLEEYADRGVRIRLIDSMLQGLLGQPSDSQSIGYGPVTTVTLLTDGTLEALDVCRIAGSGVTGGRWNILSHDLEEIVRDPAWNEIFRASLDLAPLCRACDLRSACGGGHIASRWSTERRFDNPSVYCEDYKAIFGHIWKRVAPTLYTEAATAGAGRGES